jgi:hypothetical protein
LAVPIACGTLELPVMRQLVADLTRSLDEAMARAKDLGEGQEKRRSETERVGERARLLRMFVSYYRAHPDALPVRCAWCGRVSIAGRFVLPEEFVSGDLPQRVRAKATHGICPDCLERENEKARTVRERKSVRS